MNRNVPSLALAAFVIAFPSVHAEEVQVASFVDLERYTGLWYELASTPAPFSIGCVCTTAAYSAVDADTVELFNACDTFVAGGPERTIDGIAEVVDTRSNAKLEVGFAGAPPFAPYWILDVVDDPDDPTGPYRFAAVGGPSGFELFILGRVPTIETDQDRELLRGILDGLRAQSYDTRRVDVTRQPPNCDYGDRNPFVD